MGYNIYKNAKDYLSVNHFLRSPTVKSLETKGIEQIKTELVSSVVENVDALSNALSKETFRQWVNSEEAQLKGKISSGAWLNDFQGKYIFNRLCGTILKEDMLRVRHAYVDIALEEKPEVLAEITALFHGM